MASKIDDQLQTVKKQIAALKAREQALTAKQNTEARKLDTRRKILIGAIVMNHCKQDAKFAALVQTVVKANLLKEKDKDVLNDWLNGMDVLDTRTK